MVYNFQLKADKLDSKNAANLQLPAIIMFLNEGQNSLVLKRYGGRNTTYRAALEANQKRKDEFQRLIVPDEQLGATRITDEIYTADLLKTKEKYLFLLRANFDATKNGCANRKLKGVLTETDDLDLVEGSSLDDSSFEWGECVYRLAQDKIRMRSDGTFKITFAKIDYLRYPKQMDMVGYEHFDTKVSTDIQCELPDFLHYDIVDESLLIYANSFNSADAQAKMLKLAQAE
jgi:hypothetical protein